MKEFFIDLFTWKGRWNRLKFWVYPLVVIIFALPVLGTISFMSLQGYADEARHAKVMSDVEDISMKISVSHMDNLENIVTVNNTPNYKTLVIEKEYYTNPNGEEYKIFIKDDMFEVYGDSILGAVIKGNYLQENPEDPESLVNIGGKYIKNGYIEGSQQTTQYTYAKVFILFLLLFYVIILWIGFLAYIKRLHDLNQSGWLSLISFIPLINLGLLFYCGFFKGTNGANKYGPDPLKKDGNISDQSEDTVIEL